MEINGENYDLSKISNEIKKNQICNNDEILGVIFDYFDNLDGKQNGKLSKTNLQNIFTQLECMDCEKGIKDNKLSDNEFDMAAKNLYSHLKIQTSDLKNFVIKLLNQNIINFTSENTNNETSFSAKGTEKEDRYNFRLGKKQNGIRSIGTESVATKINGNQDNSNSFVSLLSLIISSSSASVTNGYNAFSQGARGDCYFVQEINSINNTANGKEILNMNVKKLGDGSYQVILPGAVLLKQNLKQKIPDSKCEITGVYNITKEAVNKLKQQAGKAYSSGNLNVMLLELAMETYREELARTNKNIGHLQNNAYTAEGAGRTRNQDNLRGGYAWDAAFILTGQKSEVYTASTEKKQKIIKYQKGKYGFITREQMNARAKEEMNIRTKDYSEVTRLTHDENNLRSMLNKMMGKESQYAMSVGFITEKDGDDGVTKKNSSHALSVIKVTPSTVYVLNPWFKDEKGNACIEPIRRKDFEKMTDSFTCTNMDIKRVRQTHLIVMKSIIADACEPVIQNKNAIQNALHRKNKTL